MEGNLEEVSVGTGQQVGSGTILARVANTSRLMARRPCSSFGPMARKLAAST